MPDSQASSVSLDDHTPANMQVLGLARSQALATTYQGLAQSLTMLMQNSVAAAQASATIQTAIVTLMVKRLTGGLSATQVTTESDNA